MPLYNYRVAHAAETLYRNELRFVVYDTKHLEEISYFRKVSENCIISLPFFLSFFFLIFAICL